MDLTNVSCLCSVCRSHTAKQPHATGALSGVPAIPSFPQRGEGVPYAQVPGGSACGGKFALRTCWAERAAGGGCPETGATEDEAGNREGQVLGWTAFRLLRVFWRPAFFP